jgi:hypothetical protein
MTKICSKCKIEKSLTEFCKSKNRKDSLSYYCKQCSKQFNKQFCADHPDYYRQYYSNHKEEENQRSKQYRLNNKEKENRRSKQYYFDNKEKEQQRHKKYYFDHKEESNQYHKQYHLDNEEKQNQQHKQWHFNNKEKHNQQIKLYIINKLKTDINFKIACGLRRRLRSATKRNFKSGSAVKDLGCTIEFLKQHIESLFKPGMNWDNWGTRGWHIDHIIPLCKFDLTDREQLLKACHYTNLQPLWAKDNLSKNRY